MKNGTVYLLLFILVAAGGLILYRPNIATYQRDHSDTPTEKTEEETPSDTLNIPNDSLTVYYTDSGFVPGIISIKKGDTVTFVNKSSENMHVASNPHPVHTDLSGFDEKVEVGIDGSYQFVFDKVGTWSYHNHTNPTKVGIVVVK